MTAEKSDVEALLGDEFPVINVSFGEASSMSSPLSTPDATTTVSQLSTVTGIASALKWVQTNVVKPRQQGVNVTLVLVGDSPDWING